MACGTGIAGKGLELELEVGEEDEEEPRDILDME